MKLLLKVNLQLVSFSAMCASKIKRGTIKWRHCRILLIFHQKGAIWLSARSPKCTVNGASRLPCTKPDSTVLVKANFNASPNLENQ